MQPRMLPKSISHSTLTADALMIPRLSSGPFGNDELEQIVNEVEWEHRVVFGNNAQAAMAHLGLTVAPEELQETPA